MNNRSVFAIQSGASSNQDFGTGFVILVRGHAAWIVTCAHVVKDAGGVEAVRIAGLPVSSEADGSAEGIDLQVLRVEGLTEAASLVPGKVTQGAPCSIQGFWRAAGKIRSRELTGKLTNRSEIIGKHGECIEAWEVEIAGEDGLQGGFSGAPVLDAESGRVLGVMDLSQFSGKRGFCIAIDSLSQIWSEMRSVRVPAVEGPSERSAAIRITLDRWEQRLQKSPEIVDMIIEGRSLTPNEEPFHSLEKALASTLEAGLIIELYSQRRGYAQDLKNAADLWIILLAGLTLGSGPNGPLQWLIKTSVEELKKNSAEPGSNVYKVWSYICQTFCSSNSRSHQPKALERIVQAGIKRAGWNFDNLHRFFTFLFDRLDEDHAAIRRVAEMLEEYDDKLGNDAAPAFLERLKQLIGTGISSAIHGPDDIPPFRPELITIPTGLLCQYEFESMAYPLRNTDYSTIRGVPPKERAMHPYVFRIVSDNEQTLFNLLRSEIQAIIRLCNQFEEGEDLAWDVPTLCEWLSLAGCEQHPYPWGTEPPTPERSNLAYGGTMKLRPVGTHPLGVSIYGTRDCCGNVHEIVRVGDPQEAQFPHDYRLAGGCYLHP